MSKGAKRKPMLFPEPADHRVVALAKDLAEQVDRLNPNCQQIGAGYMANMRELASRILALVNQK